MSWANTFEVEWVDGRIQVCVWESDTGLERLAAMVNLLPAEAEALLHLLGAAIIDARLLSDRVDAPAPASRVRGRRSGDVRKPSSRWRNGKVL